MISRDGELQLQAVQTWSPSSRKPKSQLYNCKDGRRSWWDARFALRGQDQRDGDRSARIVKVTETLRLSTPLRS